MSRVSRDTAPEQNDFGLGHEATDHFHDYTVQFVSIREGHSLAEMLKGLPEDSCHCPHWGYVMSGQITVQYTDGHEDTIKAGDAYYMPPGHVPSAIAGTEFVIFSPQAELETTMAQIGANMQRLTGQTTP